MATVIPWTGLLWCLIPVLAVAVIFWRWQASVSEVIIASARMFIQLIAVGYVLVYLFAQDNLAISLAVVSLMLVVAGWIAVRPVRNRSGVFVPALLALGLSVGLHLFITLFLVIPADSWYQPHLLIPLAGMYFANTMNAISLAAERYFADAERGSDALTARSNAFKACMIPQINGLLAVGLVALPGMMTGQILSGVSPLVAVRYQIVIMTMLFGASGIGAALLLWRLSTGRQTP